MLPKQITQIILYGVGLGSLAAVVYFAGPFIAIGNWHPLEDMIVRSIIILLLGAGDEKKNDNAANDRIFNWHPLEDTIVRSIIILLLVAGAAAVAGFSF